MRSTRFLFRAVALSLLLTGALAQGAAITGTVTNKTTGKPAVGDAVALVDEQAGMGEVARATTGAGGRYKLAQPGQGNYLVRVTHQGANYFIAIPEGNAPADVAVYDVAAKVDGVVIDEDVVGLVETVNGRLRVVERYSVHNSSMPPRTQWSPRSFEIVLPDEAMVEGATAQRPGSSSLLTAVKLDSVGAKGRYAFNFPIQPDDGEKGTLFQIEYEVPYSGKFTFHPRMTLPARTVWAMMPRSMSFAAGAGSNFQSSPQDPGFLTFVAMNVTPGQKLEFTVSGTGSIPREGQGGQSSSQDTGATSAQPGGGMSGPLDPLSKYKGWILAGLALLLAAVAALLVRRKPAAGTATEAGTAQAFAAPADRKAALLSALKEELFALEKEKIAGTLAPAEYEEYKAALETVLRRAMDRSS